MSSKSPSKRVIFYKKKAHKELNNAPEKTFMQLRRERDLKLKQNGRISK